jgi:hypothetical protein
MYYGAKDTSSYDDDWVVRSPAQGECNSFISFAVRERCSINSPMAHLLWTGLSPDNPDNPDNPLRMILLPTLYARGTGYVLFI